MVPVLCGSAETPDNGFKFLNVTVLLYDIIKQFTELDVLRIFRIDNFKYRRFRIQTQFMCQGRQLRFTLSSARTVR